MNGHAAGWTFHSSSAKGIATSVPQKIATAVVAWLSGLRAITKFQSAWITAALSAITKASSGMRAISSQTGRRIVSAMRLTTAVVLWTGCMALVALSAVAWSAIRYANDRS